MKITILEEHGFLPAMKGLARSYNQNIAKMPAVALNLGPKDMGHNKFLESIVVWFDMNASRDFWSQFDTYRVGITKQSDSTMHTLGRRQLTQGDFEIPINEAYLVVLNKHIENKMPVTELKKHIPEGFIQGRTVCTNYKVLRNIILQRHDHKMPEWRYFCEYMMDNLIHSDHLGIDLCRLAEVR